MAMTPVVKISLLIVFGLISQTPIHALADRPFNDFIKCETMATEGDPDAQFKLAEYYHYGIYLIKDEAKEAQCYQKAASQGHLKAQAALANCYELGIGVDKSPQEAVFWRRKAAEQGDPDSQYYLGRALYYGQGVARDYPEAVKWMAMAAQNGSALGRGGLGKIYMEGEALDRDIIKAWAWLNLVSDWQVYKEMLDRLRAEMTGGDIDAARSLSAQFLKDYGKTKN